MRILDKIEKKFPKFGIPNLMLHVCILTGIVFIVSIVRPDFISYLTFNRECILQGQIWRILSFVFIPESSFFWILITLYFYYFLGTTLQNTWGTFKFTVYYFLCMLGTIIVGFVFGGVYTGHYVNLSIFLAIAMIYPNLEFMLFFIIPIKAKYMAMGYGLILCINFFMGDLTVKLSIVSSLLGFILFFTGDIFRGIKQFIRRQKYKKMLK